MCFGVDWKQSAQNVWGFIIIFPTKLAIWEVNHICINPFILKMAIYIYIISLSLRASTQDYYSSIDQARFIGYAKCFEMCWTHRNAKAACFWIPSKLVIPKRIAAFTVVYLHIFPCSRTTSIVAPIRILLQLRDVPKTSYLGIDPRVQKGRMIDW